MSDVPQSTSTVTDEAWQRALNCAHSVMESYNARPHISTEEGRKRALDDAMQHAFGLLSLGVAQAAPEPVGWFQYSDYHGWQQVAKEYEGQEGQTALYAGPQPASIAYTCPKPGAITDDVVQIACEIYSEVYIDDDKDQGDAMRAALVAALSSMSSTDSATVMSSLPVREQCQHCRGRGRVGVMACWHCGATGQTLSSTKRNTP